MSISSQKHTYFLVQHYWLARFLVSTSILLAACVFLFGSEEIMGVTAFKRSGTFPLWVLLCLSIVSLIDVVINDFLPHEYTLNHAKRNRHLWYMLQALMLVGAVYVSLKNSDIYLSHIILLFQGVGSALVAFLDLFARHYKK